MNVKTAVFIKSAADVSGWPSGPEPEVAFVGRANVGKSSLINVLTGHRGLARASGTPGRTRLINFFSINGLFRFVDLPGYGYSRVSHAIRSSWGPLASGYLRERANLKLVIFLLDSRRLPTPEDIDLANWLKACDLPTQYVLGKSDKLSRSDLARPPLLLTRGLPSPAGCEREAIRFSARTGQGREEIWSVIVDALEKSHKTCSSHENGAPDAVPGKAGN